MFRNNEVLAKRFSLIIGIVYTGYSLLNALATFLLLMASNVDWSAIELSEEDIATMSGLATSTSAIITYLFTFAYIVLTVFLYISYSKFKKEQPVSKIPYYFVVAFQIYSLISEVLSSATSLTGILFIAAIGGLAIYIIAYLFKKDKGSSVS